MPHEIQKVLMEKVSVPNFTQTPDKDMESREHLKKIPLWIFFSSRKNGPASFVMKIFPG